MVLNKDGILYIKKKYGLPCYVFNEDEFVRNYLKFENCLKTRYANYKIALSYKTNYAPKICTIVKDMGGYAEVVSDMEYDIARKIGYSNDKIIYNGPYKGIAFDEHLLNGGILNADNLTEIDRIIDLANRNEKLLKVGIRVNISVGQKFISRFGIDEDSEDLKIAAKKLSSCKYTKLVGLHCHIGQARGIEAWKTRTLKMVEIADRFIDGVPEFIDLGSGMFGDVEDALLKQFACKVPSYEEYAEVTAKIFAEHYQEVDNDKKPILFTEPGTTLDNRYVKLIAEIDSIKQIKNKFFAVTNCSFHNLGDVCCSVKLPVEIIHGSATAAYYDNIDLVGYTCLERDVPYKDFSGKLGKGDFVVFGNVGGYSNVCKPPFILPQCAMIGIKEGETYLIKRRETTEDILSTYVIG